jgi:hypothetical protein
MWLKHRSIEDDAAQDPERRNDDHEAGGQDS